MLDVDTGEFHFLEVNTRLQVEHTVTEMVTGIDLVEWMVRLAAGDTAFVAPRPTTRPCRAGTRSRRGCTPRTRRATSGPARAWSPRRSGPRDVRVDTWVRAGTEVTPYYDPLLAKIVVHGADARRRASPACTTALADTTVRGIETNVELLRAFVAGDAFARRDRHHEHARSEHRPRRARGRRDRAGDTRRCRTSPDASGCGTWACRRADRWTTGRSGSATASSATPRARPGWSAPAIGPTLRFATDAVVCLAGARD